VALIELVIVDYQDFKSRGRGMKEEYKTAISNARYVITRVYEFCQFPEECDLIYDEDFELLQCDVCGRVEYPNNCFGI
jgi:hypothetical protein